MLECDVCGLDLDTECTCWCEGCGMLREECICGYDFEYDLQFEEESSGQIKVVFVDA